MIRVANLLNHRGKIDEQLLLEALVDSKQFLSDGNILIKREDKGFWQRLNGNEGIVIRQLLFMQEEQGKVKKSLLDMVIAQLKEDTRIVVDADTLNPADKINMLNGVLKLETLELQPHKDNSDIFTYIIKANFETGVNITQAPVFEKFVNESMGCKFGSDKFTFLLECTGYLLSSVTNIAKAVFLLGKSGSGKSTYSGFIEELFPKEQVSSVALHDLSSRFNKILVASAKINVFKETKAGQIKDWSIFKSLVSKVDNP